MDRSRSRPSRRLAAPRSGDVAPRPPRVGSALAAMPIRHRMTLLYITVLGLALILFSSALYTLVRYSLYSEVDQALQTRTDKAARQMLFVQEAQRSGAVAQTLSLDSFVPPEIYMEWRLQDEGNTRSRSSNLGSRDLPLSPEAERRALDHLPTIETSRFDGATVRLLTTPVEYEGEVIALIQTARPLGEVQQNLERLRLLLIFGSLFALAVTLIAQAWIAGRILTPVDNVTQAALRISRAEDLSSRLPDYEPRTDEIGRLIAAFNEMLGSLEDVFRDQQRFVADVSHELRTPLTALQGNIDLLKRGAYSPAEQGEVLNTLGSEVARLNRLVSDLLLLARADGGERLVMQQVELDTLLLDVFRQGRLIADAAGSNVKLRLGSEDQATIVGDSDRLRQLFLNLVVNAINYNKPDGEVVLSLWKEPEAGRVLVAIRDTGIGIPAESVSLLFRRFYREDKARSRSAGGTGLGLAIVQWIVQAHDGTITVESEEGVGSTFTVSLPLPSADDVARARPITGSHRIVTPNGRR